MLNLLYLAVPLALVVLVWAAVSLRARQPKTMESSVQQFSRGLSALAPSGDQMGASDPADGGAGRRRAPGAVARSRVLRRAGPSSGTARRG